MQLNEIISSGLLELYVLGGTTEQETEQVLMWKAEYPEVAQELLAIEDSLEQLDLAGKVTPTIDTKKKIFEAVLNQNTKATNQKPLASVVPITAQKEQNNFYKYAAAACVVLLIGSALFNFSTFSKYTKANEQLTAANKANEQVKNELADLQGKIEVPLNTYSQSVTLVGTANAPKNSTAKIFWIKNTNEVYVEPSGLPTAPKGFQYQLWAIVDGKPVDGGLIIIEDGKKYNLQKMKSFGKAQAFAITLEKQGGSPTPTMEKLYVMSTI